MSVYTQAYTALLGTCKPLWDEIRAKELGINMEGAIKALANLGSMHAQSTLMNSLLTPRLKECKSFIELQIDSIYKATLYAIAGTTLLGIKIYILPTVLPSEGSIYKKIIHRACSIGGIVLLLLGIYKTAQFCVLGTKLVQAIEKLPGTIGKQTKVINGLRDAFLAGK